MKIRSLQIALLMLVLNFSCKTINLRNIEGEYRKIIPVQKNNSYTTIITVTLNNDSTFSYSNKWFEVNERCKGTWRSAGKNKLLLKCFDEPFPAQISSGYMNVREMEITIISKNKIKVNNNLLTRIREKSVN